MKPTYRDNIYRDDYGRTFAIGESVDVSSDKGLASVVEQGQQAILLSPQVDVETSAERGAKVEESRGDLRDAVTVGLISVGSAIILTYFLYQKFIN